MFGVPKRIDVQFPQLSPEGIGLLTANTRGFQASSFYFIGREVKKLGSRFGWRQKSRSYRRCT